MVIKKRSPAKRYPVITKTIKDIRRLLWDEFNRPRVTVEIVPPRKLTENKQAVSV